MSLPAARAYPTGTVLGLDGAPLAPSASRGQHVRRRGAALQGTITNWTNQVVSARLAEREKRRVYERAEDLYTNSALAHGLLEGLLVEAVGVGLTPQPAPDVDGLGLGDAWAEQWERSSLRLFDAWAFDPRRWCDASRRMTFYQLQGLGYFLWKLHGIGLFQVTAQRDRWRPVPLALLPIDPSRLQTPDTAPRGAEIYDGVEVDPRTGAAVAVHLADPSGDSVARGRTPTRRLALWHAETGLPQVLLVGDVRNVAEYRQDSVLASVVKEIRDNDDFVEAALVKALSQNLIALYVSLQNPAGGLLGSTQGHGAAGANGTPTIDWAQRVFELDKGTVIEGPPGYAPTPVANTAPGPGYDLMWRSICTRVGMATQRGPEHLTREYNSSYSAALASIENAERFSDVDRLVLNASLNAPAWAWLCYFGVLAGRLPVRRPEALLAELHAYTACDWIPPPARVVRRDVQAKADETQLATHTQTLADIWGRQSARWRTKLRQRAKELRYQGELEREFGVSFAAPAAAPAAPAGAAAAEDEQEEDDRAP